MDRQIGSYFDIGMKGSMDRQVGSYFQKEMQGSMDGRIGPNFEKRMQESTDGAIGPNLKRRSRIPRTTESVQYFKGEFTNHRFCPIFRGCKGPRTAESVQIFKGECRKYQMGLNRGQKSDRAVKWIFKTCTKAEKSERPTSSGQIWTDFL